MDRMNRKVAFVTGAASDAGIGFATARRLAREGARVALSDINGSEVKARAAALNAEGLETIAFQHDVTNENDWEAAIEEIIQSFGRLDILVNNAGIAVLKHMDVLTTEDWSRQIDVNLNSVFYGCRAGLAQMRKQGDGGAIINLSSVVGLVGVPGTAAYAASKGGIRLMTKSIALEAAAENIRCNSVHPGVIWTDMQKVSISDNPEQHDLLNESLPMKRMGEPEDIAAAVAYLASDDAKYVTGSEVVVDGGLTAQ